MSEGKKIQTKKPYKQTKNSPTQMKNYPQKPFIRAYNFYNSKTICKTIRVLVI